MNSPVLSNLELPATPSMPRTLSLMLGLLTGHLTAIVSVNHTVMMSAGGDPELTESVSLGAVLRIGTTQFRLDPHEVPQVRELLARFPTARSPIGPEPAKVASTAAFPPSGSESREPLTSAMSDVGELDHATPARALTANETY
jgi:hypothetical protein